MSRAEVGQRSLRSRRVLFRSSHQEATGQFLALLMASVSGQ
jgi:hypothetical protein